MLQQESRADLSFSAPFLSFDAGGSAWSVAVGDLNGDGKLDLVTADNGSDSASVLLGNGNGTFQPRVGVPAGDGPRWVTIGDLNGDTKPDLVVASFYANKVTVLLGNGNG